MAIKIPGTLVPSNPKNFKVADARHIAFTDEDGTKYGEYDIFLKPLKRSTASKTPPTPARLP
jgi:hypothetical protein